MSFDQRVEPGVDACPGVQREALRSRGPSDVVASLLAEVGVAVFKTAFERWVIEDADSLDTLVRESFRDVAVAVSARSATTPN